MKPSHIYGIVGTVSAVYLCINNQGSSAGQTIFAF